MANLAALGSNPVSTTGNISAGYFLGNGSQLTGLPATYGNANVATFMAAFGSNSISTSGNVSSAYFVGNGSLLTNLTGANVTGTVANATYATTAGSATTAVTANTVTDAAQANITSVGVLTALSVSGNIVTGNISSTGNVNISGNLNSDDITSTNVTVYGDQVITGNLTVQGTTTTINSNVVTTNDRNITVANNQSTSANLDGAGLDAGNSAGAPVITWRYNAATTSWQSNVGITPVANLTYDLGTNTLRWNNVYNGNVLSSGTVSAAGNITGNYFVGNGSALTGITSSYGDSNVATFMAAFGSNTITTTGNVVLGNVTAGTGNVSATNHVVNGLTANGSGWLGYQGGNTARMALNYVNGNNSHALMMRQTKASLYVDNVGSGANEAYAEIQMDIANVNAPYVLIDVAPGSTGIEYDWIFDATGNLTLPTNSSQIKYANGTSILSGIGGYGNSNVAAFMAAFGSNTITTTGNVVAGNLSVTGGITSTGNIVGQLSTAGNITGGNLTVNGLINTSGSLSLAGNISTPSGSIVGGNMTLSPGGTYSTTGNVLTGNLVVTGLINTSGSISLTGNISATGNVQAGNLRTTGLVSVTGNVIANNFSAGNVLTLSSTVALSNYNNRLYTADAQFNTLGIDATAAVTGNATVGNLLTGGQVSATGNVTGSYFLGNGSQLTGLPSTYGNANVATFMAAFGSNTITTTGNVVVGNLSGGNGNIDGRYYNIQGLTGNSTAYIGRKTNTGQGNRAVFSFTNGNTASSYNNHLLQFQPTQVNLFADYYDSGTGFDAWAEVDLVVSNPNSPFVTINMARADTGAEVYWNYDITGNITLPSNTSAINYANGTSILSGLGGYGNANVVANLAALGSNPVSTTGNITAGYFLGNGSQLTGIVSSYGNANVAANLAAFGSNPISTTGNITAGTGIISAASVSGNISGNSSSNGVRVVNYKDNVYALSYAATITPDAANGSIQQVTLTGNVTWNAFGGTPQAGQSMVVSLTQDGTGSRLLSSTMKFAGGSKTLSTAAGSIDIISVFFDGTNYFASLTKGYA